MITYYSYKKLLVEKKKLIFDFFILQQNRGNLARLSSSCPSLNMDEEGMEDDDSPSCKSGGSSSAGVVGVPRLGDQRRGSGRSIRSDDSAAATSNSLDDHHLCPDTPKIRVNDSTPTGKEGTYLNMKVYKDGIAPLKIV